MLSKDQVQQLVSENEHLQIQLQDLNEMISIREEELDILRLKARRAVELQSRLEGTLNEMEQLQNFIGDKQQQAEGAARREASMENEILQSIKIEHQYYEIRDQYNSTKAALADIHHEAESAKQAYKDLADAQSKISELKSQLEIEAEEKELLKYELGKLRKQLSLLQNKE